MSEPIPHGTAVAGPHGIAEPFTNPSAPATLCAYLITAPTFHPLWSQYVLCVVTLAPMPGLPPAVLKFPGATHELLVVSLNPEAGHRTVANLSEPDMQLSHLLPFNIVEQFEATDTEMQSLAWLLCRAVVDGRLTPETADAPTLIRGQWLTACVKTLAHERGEEHAP